MDHMIRYQERNAVLPGNGLLTHVCMIMAIVSDESFSV